MQSFVTFEWLIGTGLVVVGFVITIFLASRGSKVDSNLCMLRHEGLDNIILDIKKVAEDSHLKLEHINDTVIWIKAKMNGEDHL